jgi:hypothetical protein
MFANESLGGQLFRMESFDNQTQGARAMTNILDLQRLPEINGLNLLDADQATCTVCSYTCCCTAAE